MIASTHTKLRVACVGHGYYVINFYSLQSSCIVSSKRVSQKATCILFYLFFGKMKNFGNGHNDNNNNKNEDDGLFFLLQCSSNITSHVLC